MMRKFLKKLEAKDGAFDVFFTSKWQIEIHLSLIAERYQ